jgi:Domain of unknown function (DUF4352)
VNEHQATTPPGITPPDAVGEDTTQTMAPAMTPTAPELTQILAPDLTQTMAPDAAQPTPLFAAEEGDTEATPPWFKRKRYAFPSAVLVAFVVIMIGTGGNDPGIFDRTRSAAELKADLANSVPTGTIGQSVRDGKFAFVVTSSEVPRKTITGRLGTIETAQGFFVIVRVNVTNIGYDARTLTPTNQFLISDRGQRFATSAAISSLPGAETIFLNKVNPGHTVTDAPLLFDVPAGTTITGVELHDSVSSTGVKLKLS